MPNLRELENAMPVAPLKIVALPSAERMGQRINDYMISFRKNVNNDKVKKNLRKYENFYLHVDIEINSTALCTFTNYCMGCIF